ncbi:MAG: SCO1664 family protein [Anaerolineae bacterium]|nr:SCO1664 family protein [Anaerolineae bacterium]
MDSTDQPLSIDGAEEVRHVTVNRVLEALRCGAIAEQHGILGWSSNYTSLVTLVDGDLELLAVYKPQRGERPLWDFPEGTLCRREVAAFLVSATLDWDIVPPTVLRKGPKGLGSVQLFIHHNPEEHFFNFTSTPELAERMKQFAAFDIVTNNADRKGGHFIRDAEGHIWGIDQGLTFNVAPKLRTVLWDFAGEPVPDAILSDLEKLCASLEPGARLDRALRTALDAREVRAVQKRVKRLLQDKTYPHPGPGPNYPWPPI